METLFTRRMTVLPSQLDPDGRLGVANTFDLFMDTATEAAGEMGVGWDFLKRRGLFWITVKTRVVFIDPPRVLDEVEVVTWADPPRDKRCDRHYEIRRDGQVLVQGDTEWAIVSMLTRQPQRLEKVMPEGLVYPAEPVAAPEFPRIGEDFAEPAYAVHRVGALDIDMARHMNNVAYVRAVVNSFSTKEWKRMGVREFAIVFRASAHEGDELQLQKRAGDGCVDIRGSLPGGKTIVLARLTTR